MEPFQESLEHVNEGIDLKYQKEYQKSLGKFRKAISKNPKNTEAYYQCGNILYATKKYKKAGHAFSQAVRIKPSFVYGLIHWGNCLFLQCEYAEAIKIYMRVIEQTPNDGLSYNNWACCLYSLRCYHEALGKFMQAVCLNNRMNLGHFNLSLLLFHLDNPKEAIRVFREGLKASEAGFYMLNEIKDSYILQSNHIKEEIPKQVKADQVEYLEKKLQAIEHILKLLNKQEFDQTDLEGETIKIEYNQKEEPQSGLSLIIASETLLGYFCALNEQVCKIFLALFVIEDSHVINYNKNLLYQMVSSFCNFVSSHYFYEDTDFAESIKVYKSLDNNEDLFAKISKRCGELGKILYHSSKIMEFVQLLVKKMAIWRKGENMAILFNNQPITIVPRLSQDIFEIIMLENIQVLSEELIVLDSFTLVLAYLLDDSMNLDSDKSFEGLLDGVFLSGQRNLAKLIKKECL